jgi:hypothetical protein
MNNASEERLALATWCLLGSTIFFSWWAMGDYVWFIWGVVAPLAFLVLVPLLLSFPTNYKYHKFLVYFGAMFLAVFGAFWSSLGVERSDSKTCAGTVVRKWQESRANQYFAIEVPCMAIQCSAPERVALKFETCNMELEVNDHVQLTYRAESLLGDPKPTLVIESVNNSQFVTSTREFRYDVGLLASLIPLIYLIFPVKQGRQ